MQKSLDTNQEEPGEPRLYTVADFHRRIAAIQRANLFWLVVFVVGVFAFLAVLGLIRLYIGPEPEGATQPSVTVMVLLSLAVIGEFLIVACAGVASERDNRKYAVTCESCGKDLGVVDLSFAIAIHGCPYCQNALFQEWNNRTAIMALPDAAGRAPGEFTFADISEGEMRQTRAKGIWFAKIAVIAVVVFGIARAVIWFKYDLLTATFGDRAQEIANLICLIPASVVLGVGSFWALCRTPGAFPKCGECGTRIANGRYIRATGNCSTCGQRVIRDGPLLQCEDDLTEGKRIDRAELAASVAYYKKWIAWSVVIIYGIGGLGWGGLFFLWHGIASKSESLGLGKGIIAIAGMIVLIVVLCRVMHRLTPRARCPHCQQLLDSLCGLVLATGNCSHCGRRVLKSEQTIELHAKS